MSRYLPWRSWAAHDVALCCLLYTLMRSSAQDTEYQSRRCINVVVNFAFRSARWSLAHKTKTILTRAHREALVAPTRMSKSSSATFALGRVPLGRCATQRHTPHNVRRPIARTSERAPDHSAPLRCSLVLAFPRGAACTAGSFCPHGSAAGTFCPPGTTGTSTNLTSAEECSTCSRGHYCVGGSQTRCGRSTYNPIVGQAMQTACRSCPSKSVTRGIAATSLADCVCIAGYYNHRPANESVECLLCPAGSKCVDGGMTLASLPLITG